MCQRFQFFSFENGVSDHGVDGLALTSFALPAETLAGPPPTFAIEFSY
jgi:hypothetical protein